MHLEALLHYRIAFLSLTVSLWVEGHGRSSIDPKVAAEASPEGGGELRFPIRYDGQQQPMQLEYVLQKEVGKSFSVDCQMTWNQIPGLSNAVHDYLNRIETIRLG
jgi:hypothetical protein